MQVSWTASTWKNDYPDMHFECLMMMGFTLRRTACYCAQPSQLQTQRKLSLCRMRGSKPATSKRFSKAFSCSGYGALSFIILCGLLVLNKPQRLYPPLRVPNLQRGGGVVTFGPVLVLYVFSDNDPNYRDNLRFFVREGVRANDGADYIFAVQLHPDGQPPNGLPNLPNNAQYVFHKNECYDWGTFGWVLRQNIVRRADYKYFVFMNASVRGPFFPPYQTDGIHWTEPFVSRINDVVKLVGPTISCEGSQRDVRGLQLRENPHVQSYLLATDSVGLQILLDDPLVFACHNELQEVIYCSELGSSAAILRAGYSLDSLMLRYQGVDWRNKENWNCNNRENPYVDSNYDGVFINPLEVVFVKVKDARRGGGSAGTALLAKKYAQWSTEANEAGWNVSTNRPAPSDRETPHQCHRQLHAQGCLDVIHYKRNNPDLPSHWSNADFFAHFFNHGQREKRKHRFTCLNKLEI